MDTLDEEKRKPSLCCDVFFWWTGEDLKKPVPDHPTAWTSLNELDENHRVERNGAVQLVQLVDVVEPRATAFGHQSGHQSRPGEYPGNEGPPASLDGGPPGPDGRHA